MNEELQQLESKITNEGATPQGRVSSSEWNILVNAAKNMDLSKFGALRVEGNSVDFFADPASAALYASDPATYSEYLLGSFPLSQGAELTGEAIVAALGYTPFNSANFSTNNIKTTLGISDWALAPTRPSYTAADVGALSLLGGTLSQDSGTNSIVLNPLKNDEGVAHPQIALTEYYGGNSYTYYVQSYGGDLHLGSGTSKSLVIDNEGNILAQKALTVGGALVVGQYDLNENIYLTADKNTTGNDSTTMRLIDHIGGNYLYINPSADIEIGDTASPITHLYGVSFDINSSSEENRGFYFSHPIFVKNGSDYEEIGSPDLTGYATETWVGGQLSNYLPISGTANSATKLATPRTIWGQSFDGTGNVGGKIVLDKGGGDRQFTLDQNGTIGFSAGIYGWVTEWLTFTNNRTTQLGSIAGAYGEADSLNYLYYGGTYDNPYSVILPNGNVAIGGTTATEKLQVHGNVKATSFIGDLIRVGVTNSSTYITLQPTSNNPQVVLNSGSTSSVYALQVSGDMLYLGTQYTPTAVSIDASGNIATLGSITANSITNTGDFGIGEGSTLHLGDNVDIYSDGNFANCLILRTGNGMPIMINTNTELILGTGQASAYGTYVSSTSVFDEANLSNGFYFDRPLYVYSSDSLGGVLKKVLVEGDVSIDLTGYATETWVGGQLSNYLPISGTANSATKLATPRTIWGQSFDGTGNVTGTFRLLYKDSYNGDVAHSILNNSSSPYGLLTRIYGNGEVSLQSQRETTTSEYFDLSLNPLGGNVAIGGTTADAKLQVHGTQAVTQHLSVGAVLSHDITGRAEMSIVSTGDNPTDLMLGYNGIRRWSITARSATSTAAESLGVYNYVNSSWALVVNDNNNIAIGGTSADEKLQVYGNIRADGSIIATNDLTVYGALNVGQYDLNENIYLTADKNTDVVNDKTTARLVDTLFGNYLYINPSAQVTITNAGGEVIDETYGVLFSANATDSRDTSKQRAYFFDKPIYSYNGSSWEQLSLSSIASYVTTEGSDRAIKTNLSKVTNAGDRLLSLGDVYDFEYADWWLITHPNNKGHHIGLVYQNVLESAMAEQMCTIRDNYGALTYQTADVTSLLVAVGQDHETRIRELERENVTLRAKIEKMQNAA